MALGWGRMNSTCLQRAASRPPSRPRALVYHRKKQKQRPRATRNHFLRDNAPTIDYAAPFLPIGAAAQESKREEWYEDVSRRQQKASDEHIMSREQALLRDGRQVRRDAA